MSFSLCQPSAFSFDINRSWSPYTDLEDATSVTSVILLHRLLLCRKFLLSSLSLTSSLSASHAGLPAVLLFLAHTRQALPLGLCPFHSSAYNTNNSKLTPSSPWGLSSFFAFLARPSLTSHLKFQPYLPIWHIHSPCYLFLLSTYYHLLCDTYK